MFMFFCFINRLEATGVSDTIYCNDAALRLINSDQGGKLGEVGVLRVLKSQRYLKQNQSKWSKTPFYIVLFN